MTGETHDPLDLDAEDAASAERAEAERQKQIRWESDFKWFMGSKQGRRLAWWLLDMSGMYANPFVPGRDGTTEFQCGMQRVGRNVMDKIDSVCPERYHEMVKERQQDERSRNRS